MRAGVEEAVAGVAGLKTLRGTHKAWDAVDGCGAGEGRGQPGVQGQGIGHRAHAGVNGRRAVEGEHGRVTDLHGAGVHFLLSTPLCPAVLEPDLIEEIREIMQQGTRNTLA